VIWIIVAFLMAIAIAIFFTGCASKAVAESPDPFASSAVEEVEEPAQTPPSVNPLIKQFGDVVTYEDNVSISVALIGPFTPGEYAQGIVEGYQPTVFKVVLTNNSDKPLEPTAIASATSGGKPAEYIADIANAEYGDLGLFPTTSVLPGQTLEWYTAFSVSDPSDITLEISPTSFDYDQAIFTTVPF
jgi:hypothetical protein